MDYVRTTPGDQGALYFPRVGWDDLRYPATGINPPGQVSDPDVDIVDGTFLFDKASTEIIMGVSQMPHIWKAGSIIDPHLHWQSTDDEAGNVLWRLEYQIADIDSSFPGSWTALDALSASLEEEEHHIISEFASIDMGGHTISCIIKWRVSRIGGDGTDTYDNDAKLLEFDIHYQIDSIGSEVEHIKN